MLSSAAGEVTETDYAMRTMVSVKQLLKDNPELRNLEQMGMKDKDYSRIIHHIRTNTPLKLLPDTSEGRRMGGEWARLEILTDFEVIVFNENDGVSRIYPPVSYRDKFLDFLHQGGRKHDSMLRVML